MDAVSITDDQRLYVIGDIHGRSDLLDEVIQEIGQDLVDNPPDNAIVVTLGDYVDRGPDSRGVLDRLARNPFPIPYVALKGNHEELFELFLEHRGKHDSRSTAILKMKDIVEVESERGR